MLLCVVAGGAPPPPTDIYVIGEEADTGGIIGGEDGGTLVGAE